MQFSSISEVREKIDIIDSQLVKLIAKRSECVKAAASFKKDTQDVKAPNRVQQVIDKVTAIAAQYDLSPEIIQPIYRTMINTFIEFEIKQHRQINQSQHD